MDSVISEPGSAGCTIDVISSTSNEGVNGGMIESEVNNTVRSETDVTDAGYTTQGESVPKTTECETQKSDDSAEAMYDETGNEHNTLG